MSLRRWKMATAAAAALAVTMTAGAAMAAPSKPSGPVLERRAGLGVAIEGAEGGAKVLSVAPGSTAEKAGLRTGDVVTGLNGQPVPDHRALVSLASQLRAGDAVALEYRRDGKTTKSSTRAIERPRETYTGAKAVYGAAPFRGGLLRDILVTPDKARVDGPVVYIVQGYYCATMEGPQPGDAYRALTQGLVDNGIATYRIEKPGMGDSKGGPNCFETDFATELDAFRTGFKTLTEVHGVDPRRIVVLGHSMGGVQAPLLAAESPPVRGVAVYGTVVRNWHDYMQDLMRVQAFFSSDVDPAEAAEFSEAVRPLLDRLFKEDVSLKQIAADSPVHAELLRTALQWDGNELILGRTAAYWRGVGDQRLTTAWRDTKAPVLSVYGEADFAAIDDRDHRLIVDIVNHYRPGTATFVMLPRSGHGFGLEGTREEVRAGNKAATTPKPPAPYNPALTALLADWINGLPTPAGG